MDTLITRLSDTVTSTFRAVATRVFVHFCGLMWVGAVVSSSLGDQLSGVLPAFDVYVGFICLFPGVVRLRADWVFPTSCGALQCLILAVSGMPVPLTLVWGGLQTWLQRFLQKKGKMGWEYSALPWLLLAAGSSYSYLAAGGHQVLFLGSSILLLVTGRAGYLLYMRFRRNSLYRGMLEKNLRMLREMLEQNKLGAEYTATAQEIASVSEQFLAIASFRDDAECALIVELDMLVPKLEKQRVGQTQENLPQRLHALRSGLTSHVSQHPAQRQKRTPEEQAVETMLAPYSTSCAKLEQKLGLLPAHLQKQVASIATQTQKILGLMRDDPQDRTPGERFLTRYLKAAHFVVDEYLRLGAEQAANSEIQTVLEKSEEMLARLDSAFQAEHARLLKNDTMTFSAELQALDTLLSMRGQ